ncbi:MAG: hypothetical protein J6S64_02415 [Bacteroidales bacterium]|nr:hypothetical protein [Bacteroidales bacterium]
MRKRTYSVYLEEKQIKYLEGLAGINNKPVSAFVRIAIDLMADCLGGYENDFEANHE